MMVPGVADVVDAPRGDAARVGDDRLQRVDAVGHIGERALLIAAVDQTDLLSAHDLAENCVTTREDPSLVSNRESSPEPIQLNGLESV